MAIWEKSIIEEVNIHQLGGGPFSSSIRSTIEHIIKDLDQETIITHAFNGSILPEYNDVAFIALESRVNVLGEANAHQVLNKLITLCDIPVLNWVWCEDEYSTTKVEFKFQNEFKRHTFFKLRVIRQMLIELEGILSNEEKFQILRIFSYYSTPGVPWSNQEIAEVARIQEVVSKEEIDMLIQSTLKPLLANLKSTHQNSKITKSGYKKQVNNIISGLRPQIGLSNIVDESRSKWKSKEIKSISLLNFILTFCDSDIIKSHWAIFTSSILNILDDHDGAIKLQGCVLLSLLLDRVDNEYLIRTGVSEIFSDAVKPCLSYLPALVPIKLSITILDCAYPVLIKLINKSSHNQDKSEKLSDLLNSGVLSSILTVKDKFEILSVLLNYAGSIIEELGVYGCQNLTTVLYQICNILTDPFIMSSLTLLYDCLSVMIIIITNCWQRIDSHRYDILAAVIITYKRLLIDDIKDDMIDHLIEDIFSLLRTVASNKKEFDDDMKAVALNDVRFSRFCVTVDVSTNQMN